MITKNKLDKLAEKYETTNFILNDPIRYLHKYQNEEDSTIAGFIASLFAYGSRKAFLKKLDELMQIMNNKPHNYILSFNEKNKDLDNFEYRFSKGCDIKEIFLILNKLYTKDNSSLKKLFLYGWEKNKSIKGMLICVTDYFYSNIKNEVTNGFYHLIPNAHKSSAMKRMNMFLRWMVRDGLVDKGFWTFIPKSELIIPLDTHVARLSVELGIIQKSNGNFKTAEEITKALKKYNNEDPIKYDFALFGYGVNN